MLDLDLAWLGGIWDGEGSITVFTNTEKNGRLHLCPTICVTNTDWHIISKVIEITEKMGIHLSVMERKPTKERHKLCWNLITRNQTYIKTFLELMTPFIFGEKLAKAKVLLIFVNRRIAVGKQPYDKEDFSFVEKIRSSETTRETP